MDAETIRACQAPLKRKFREEPQAAMQTLVATGWLAERDKTICEVASHLGTIPAGLHRSTGGDGSLACSAEMLLEALVGCAGVTLGVVSTALGITLENVSIRAEGELDFRGTLGVERTVPVGFQKIHLIFSFDSSADAPTLDKLMELTERYCVVFRTLEGGVPCSVERRPAS